MSHYTVMVIGAEPEDQLAPFDENLETPRYVSYTREQLIEKEKKSIEDYKNGLYAEFLADPEKYRAECVSNPAHIKYLENEFPKKLSWNDDDIYQEAIKWYESEDIGENGEVYSTYNPDKYRISICEGLCLPLQEKKHERNQVESISGNEILSPMLTRETITRFFDSNKKPGWKVQLLQCLSKGEEQEKNSGVTPEVAFNAEVQNHPEGIYDDVSRTEGSLSHMQPTREEQEMVSCRSLSQNWEEQESFMHSLQHQLGAAGGELRIVRCNERLPHKPHVVSKNLIGGSKWDWYLLGGRWSGMIKLKEGASGEIGEPGSGGNETGIDQAMKGDIANLDELSTFAVLKDGEWFERGKMGWWGSVSNGKDVELWKSELQKLVHDLPDETLISIYDCHI